MKKDSSIRQRTIAAINRSVMNPEEWIYSKVSTDLKNDTFSFEDNELPIFEVETPKAKTIITTRRILEKEGEILHEVNFDDIDDIIFGDFKGRINKPELSMFRIVDIYGEEQNFQMETGKAAIGLIRAINTVTRLRANINSKTRYEF
ncbi:hypothetical protein [Flavobacterium hydatis]|uniref:Uncharacterized protein n=1 Tax=Flavobacterium hydatis TaxID=991 RepID=A0A086AGH9_FLAHY|nr:hypothetical protein [Flavobacterium hydatis]KFF15793.1 hypothetical protein IW20_12895 [Flavobacterium hydatis]OXA85962.1 hypothetical protein B0A62_23930 [Flavobacterium hydatis]